MKHSQKSPYIAPEPVGYGPPMIQARLKDGKAVNLVNETPIGSVQDYAAVVLVREDGAELELLGKTTPYGKAKTFFDKL